MSKKILLVEDNFYLSELYSNALIKAGFEVIIANDGEQADELAEPSFDLILLDIMLPKKTGAELLAKWRKDKKFSTVPIILLSNMGKEDLIDNLFKLGADGYILKSSITPSKLVNEIQTFIDTRNQIS